MINLHSHSLFSDGVLIPSELARRAEAKGYEALAITDHIDMSNIETVIPRMVTVCTALTKSLKTKIIPGAEISHVPLDSIDKLVKRTRTLGARLVLVHGETIVEPVIPGTNRLALEAGVDILAHPGLINRDDVKMAAEKGILLEISSRKGHCLTNGHVARMAKEEGAKLVFGIDIHEPSDLVTMEEAERIAQGAGLNKEEVVKLFDNARYLVDKVLE